MYHNKLTKSQDRCDRLLSGLLKFEETNKLVVEMKEELTVLGPKLEKKFEDTEELMAKLVTDQQQVNAVKAVLKKEQELTDRETKKVEYIALDAQNDLDNAIPQLEVATAALDALNKYDIGEIRSYAKPPIMVMTVLSAVCVILAEKPDWPTAKQLLSDPHFLKRLINFDHQNLPDKIYHRLKKYTKNTDFNPLTVGKISVACKSMCSWVLALEHYTEVYKIVKPKQEKCEETQAALSDACEKLLAKKAALKKVEDQLHVLQKQHQDSVDQLNELQQSKELTMTRLKRAALSTEALTIEKDRWSMAVKQLQKESTCVLCEAITASAATSYLGPFTPAYRSNFLGSLVERIKEHSIEVPEQYNLIEAMTDPVQIQDWMNSGLPHDNHSTQNALFIYNTLHWPYIIDPQQQAFKWIKGKEKGNKLKVIKANDPNLMRYLENSIRLGEVVIIQNATAVLDPALDPILHRNLTKRGNQSILLFGDTEIEYNENFHLYILTDMENPNLFPELCIKVTVVNFIITMQGLTDQVLSKIVQQKNPELENKRNNALRVLVHEQFQLTELENHSLNLLHNSKGCVLDDEDLIDTLNSSKNISEGIKQRVLEAEETQRRVTKRRETYLPLAKRGALLYFIASDLSSIDSVYHFSLHWFMDLFRKCIALHKPDSVEEESQSTGGSRPSSARVRLNEAKEFAATTGISRHRLSLIYSIEPNSDVSYVSTMIELVTDIFYKIVSYSLFARHQLLFSFYLTTRILLYKNIITSDEYNFLLCGKSSNINTQDYYLRPRQASFITLSSRGKLHADIDHAPLKSMSQSQWIECGELSECLPCFTGLHNHIRSNGDWWSTFMSSKEPVEWLRKTFEGGDNDSEFNINALSGSQQLLLIKILCPDKFISCVSSFVSSTMGKAYVTPSGFDLQDLYEESDCRTPLMFILSPGSDPSSQLLRFVKEVRGSTLHLDMISLGRGQGLKAVEAIKHAYTQKGSWVFLQNCHLELSFMPTLEVVVRELSDPDIQVNQQFRLWLSSKPDPLLPVSILHSSMKVTVEPPPGVKSNLQNSFAAVGGVISETLFENYAVNPDFKKLVYSACFFHAVVQERRKFGCLGWNIAYDFITSDLEVAVLTLQDLLSRSSTIPWKALQLLTGEIIYGGRVTDKWDQRCLLTLLKRFYTENMLNEDFSYCQLKAYVPPSGDASFSDCDVMIENLPSTDHPQIFGMNENAMYEYNREEGLKLMKELNAMLPRYMLNNDSITRTDAYIIKKAKEILKMLPNKINITLPKAPLKMSASRKFTRSLPAPNGDSKGLRPHSRTPSIRTKSLNTLTTDFPSEQNIDQTPLQPTALATAMDQELRRFNALLGCISNTLESLCEALSSETLITEKLENISKAILQNEVPNEWEALSYKSCKSLSPWIINLRKRIDFITRWIEYVQVNDSSVLSPPRAIWLSALFYPQGILTAMLQTHARKSGSSIDSLIYDYKVTEKMWTSNDVSSDKDILPNDIAFKGDAPPETGFYVFGIFLDGASWDASNQSITGCPVGRRICPLPEIHFIPKKVNSAISSKPADYMYECPVYQTSKRQGGSIEGTDFVTSIFLPTSVNQEDWVLSGLVALFQTDD